jgi:hypothetical protein
MTWLFCVSAQTKQNTWQRLSGDYSCRNEANPFDQIKPSVRLNAETGAMTVSRDQATFFSGMATRAQFGKLKQVEFWLNWRAQAGIRVAFALDQNQLASTARLALPDSVTQYTCTKTNDLE